MFWRAGLFSRISSVASIPSQFLLFPVLNLMKLYIFRWTVFYTILYREINIGLNTNKNVYIINKIKDVALQRLKDLITFILKGLRCMTEYGVAP